MVVAFRNGGGDDDDAFSSKEVEVVACHQSHMEVEAFQMVV